MKTERFPNYKFEQALEILLSSLDKDPLMTQATGRTTGVALVEGDNGKTYELQLRVESDKEAFLGPDGMIDSAGVNIKV